VTSSGVIRALRILGKSSCHADAYTPIELRNEEYMLELLVEVFSPILSVTRSTLGQQKTHVESS